MTSILIPFLIFLMTAGNISPVYLTPESESKFTVTGGVLRGSIAESKDLPEEFYGTWSVTGNVIKSNDPIYFKKKSSDIWTFVKIKDIIILTNPVSKASASISVNEVEGKTATFTRETIDNKSKQYEIARITVNGDEFYGTDKITVEYYRKGKLIDKSVVEYEVRGSKISGPRLEDIFSKY